MLCNVAISIASIEGGKLTCARTQNRTFFKMLGFHISGHIHVYVCMCSTTPNRPGCHCVRREWQRSKHNICITDEGSGNT